MGNNKISYQAELSELYRTGKTIGRSGAVVNATGLSSINNLLTIRNIILDKKPRKTLEVGLAYGGSAVTMLRSLSDVHPDTEFAHSAIDPGQESFDFAGLEIVGRIGLEQKFHFYGGSSDLILPKLTEEGKRYDIIYIDGYHIFENVFIDMFYSIKILEIGGILLFDDCADKHVKKVIRFINRNLSGFMQEFSLDKYQPAKSLIKKMANKMGYRQICAFKKTADLPRVWDAPFSNF